MIHRLTPFAFCPRWTSIRPFLTTSGFNGKGLMKDAWAIWEKVRNKGAHDILRNEKEQKVDSHFTAIGRLAGAINVLVLRMIGYTGIARTSCSRTSIIR